MKHFLAACCIVCGLLFLYGFFLTDRIRLSTREDDRKNLYVMVTLNNVNPEYRWVRLFGCAAAIDDDAGPDPSGRRLRVIDAEGCPTVEGEIAVWVVDERPIQDRGPRAAHDRRGVHDPDAKNPSRGRAPE